MLILAINPGSTSTKLSIFSDARETHTGTIIHPTEELSAFASIAGQYEMRLAAVHAFLAESGVDAEAFSAVIGRGGLLRPVESGVYSVNEKMRDDLLSGRYGEHASNLGGLLAERVACGRCPAFIADPVVVDELAPEARLSGIPEIPRRSVFHALNQKSAAREACLRRGLRYEEADLIVAHLGGGVSVGAHRQGRVVDVNNALDGDGPFSPERSGTLPAGQLLTLALSGEKSEAHLRRLLTGGGGLVAYCGTNSLRELRNVIAQGQAGALPPASAPASGGTFSAPDAGSPATVAEAAIAAMVYQIAQEIAKHGATLLGAVDLVVLTGGMAHDHELVESISRRVAYLAPIEVIPGEREMESLAAAATRALRGEQEVREYQ